MAETIDELVRRFREAAISKGAFQVNPREDHRLHAEMARAFRALESRGPEVQAAFQSLLLDQSAHVRSWVAAQMLSQGEGSARSVLEQLRKDPGLLGFEAEIVLEQYRRGKLASPFGAGGA